jgi:hypothetical protein
MQIKSNNSRKLASKYNNLLKISNNNKYANSQKIKFQTLVIIKIISLNIGKILVKIN